MPPPKGERPLLLLGADGQVGQEVRRLAAEQGLKLTALNRSQLDITRKRDVGEAVDRGFGAVVNAAAYTAVDKAESEEKRAFAVNCEGAGHVAEACFHSGARLVHLSTDYVFDGAKGAPYREDDSERPVNVYGRSKQAGEVAVRAAGGDFVILRTSWVFGAAGGNFVKTMLRLGGERAALNIVADQFGCPTPAAPLAERILAAASAAPRGTFHCAGAERISWYDFAWAIFTGQEAITGHPGPQLSPIATADYKTAARRPMDSTLDSSLFQATFGQPPIDWRDGLRDVLRTLVQRPA